jgi:hypothetical protein
MEKINRLGWAEGFSIRSFGVRIGVRASRKGFVESLAARLPLESKPYRGPVVDRMYSFVVNGPPDPRRNIRRFNIAYSDSTRIARDPGIEPVLDAFESDVQLVVAHEAKKRVFVHAGVVGWKGRAVVIAGRSFSGKTTLVAELLKLGAEYYSDEYAVLDMEGRVRPYPRPLAIRPLGTTRGAKHSPESLGAKSGRKPIRIGLLLDTYYRENARWRPREVSRGAGAIAMLRNTVSARNQPSRNLPVLRAAVGEAIVVHGVRGEAEAMARDILRRLDLT